MYSAIKSVQILVALLKEYGIKNLVLSAGARNVPFVHSVETDPYFNCYSVVDERSAAFFAMGIAQKTNKPVAISCTSSTACCNYLSGVTEAYYHKVPVLIITCDRDPYFLNQMETLMIKQPGMYRDVSKTYVQLPIVKSDEDLWYCKRLVCEAILELNHHGKGPVQINVPITSGSSNFTVEKLPKVNPIRRYDILTPDTEWKSMSEMLVGKRILVIAGQNDTTSDALKNAINGFVKKFNCVVSVEHTSNLHSAQTVHTYPVCELLNQDEFNQKYAPDIVISFGGNIASSKTKTLLRGNCSKQEHWLISDDGKIMDTYKCQTKVFECAPEFFFEKIAQFADNANAATEYFDLWNDKKNSIVFPESLPFSNVTAVGKLFKMIPAGSILHTSILNSTRVSQYYDFQSENITTYSNLAAYGIDGCMSTFMGQAAVHDGLAYLIIGDLSFFYDMNSIWIRHVKNNVRIFLINNEGGAEFHLAFGKELIPEINLHTSAEHHCKARAWVESNNFKYISASNEQELIEGLKEFNSESDRPILFEVFTDKEKDAQTVRDFYKANGKISKKEQNESFKAKLISKGINIAKKIMK